jgi:hypothetical protein
VIAGICNEHLPLVGYVNPHRVFEFAWARSFFTKKKFSLASTVENQHPVVHPIDQVDIPVGTDRDIARLVRGSVDVAEESTVDTVEGVRVVGINQEEKTYNNID